MERMELLYSAVSYEFGLSAQEQFPNVMQRCAQSRMLSSTTLAPDFRRLGREDFRGYAGYRHP